MECHSLLGSMRLFIPGPIADPAAFIVVSLRVLWALYIHLLLTCSELRKV